MSFWEIAIKSSLNKANFTVDVDEIISRSLISGSSLLNLKDTHITALSRLPYLNNHRDPFDRTLLARCSAEGIALISADKQLQGYGVDVIW